MWRTSLYLILYALEERLGPMEVTQTHDDPTTRVGKGPRTWTHLLPSHASLPKAAQEAGSSSAGERALDFKPNTQVPVWVSYLLCYRISGTEAHQDQWAPSAKRGIEVIE